MNQKIPYQPDNDAFSRYLSGESGKTEIKEIEKWRSANTTNEELFLQIKTIWNDVGVIKNTRIEGLDLNAAWYKVLDKRGLSLRRRQKNTFYSRWRIAAGVLIILCAGILLWLYSNENQTIVTAESMMTKHPLPDGSIAVLRTNSSIEYLGSFNKRQLTLNGEAFFNVNHQKNDPFTVFAARGIITVLGTKFNIREDVEGIEVFVESGSVAFTYDSHRVVLESNEKARYRYADNRMIVLSKPEGNQADQFWRTRTLKYSSISLIKVIEDLEKAYDEQITLNITDPSQCHISVTFENESIENVLNIIALTLGLEVKVKGEGFELSGPGCVDF